MNNLIINSVSNKYIKYHFFWLIEIDIYLIIVSPKKDILDLRRILFLRIKEDKEELIWFWEEFLLN